MTIRTCLLVNLIWYALFWNCFIFAICQCTSKNKYKSCYRYSTDNKPYYCIDGGKNIQVTLEWYEYILLTQTARIVLIQSTKAPNIQTNPHFKLTFQKEKGNTQIVTRYQPQMNIKAGELLGNFRHVAAYSKRQH